MTWADMFFHLAEEFSIRIDWEQQLLVLSKD